MEEKWSGSRKKLRSGKKKTRKMCDCRGRVSAAVCLLPLEGKCSKLPQGSQRQRLCRTSGIKRHRVLPAVISSSFSSSSPFLGKPEGTTAHFQICDVTIAHPHRWSHDTFSAPWRQEGRRTSAERRHLGGQATSFFNKYINMDLFFPLFGYIGPNITSGSRICVLCVCMSMCVCTHARMS